MAVDENHKNAAAIYESLKKSRTIIFTSDYILDETLTLTMARENHTQSIAAGKALFESSVIKIVYVAPEYLQASWELYQKYRDKRFSFTDVTSLVITKVFGIKKIFGFDREFEKVGMELLR